MLKIVPGESALSSSSDSNYCMTGTIVDYTVLVKDVRIRSSNHPHGKNISCKIYMNPNGHSSLFKKTRNESYLQRRQDFAGNNLFIIFLYPFSVKQAFSALFSFAGHASGSYEQFLFWELNRVTNSVEIISTLLSRFFLLLGSTEIHIPK